MQQIKSATNNSSKHELQKAQEIYTEILSLAYV